VGDVGATTNIGEPTPTDHVDVKEPGSGAAIKTRPMTIWLRMLSRSNFRRRLPTVHWLPEQ
jgi:hypothetical protein